MKIVTASAMFELGGSDDNYVTEVLVALESTIENGVLDGDLYLVGGGDPVLSTPDYIDRFGDSRAWTDFTALADAVALELTQLEVTEIRGGVVGDETRYPEEERDYTSESPSEGADPIWKDSFVDENQAGPLSALLLDDGFTSWPEDPLLRRENARASDPAAHAAGIFDDLLEERGLIVRRSPTNGIAPAARREPGVGQCRVSSC